MTTTRFDLQALFHAIDAERTRQQLTWARLARHVGVSASTIRRYQDASDAEADGVLILLQWLGAAPEDYIAGSSTAPVRLTPVENGPVRVDMNLVADASQDPRGADGRTRTTIQRLVRAAQDTNQSVASLTRTSDI
ncbi:MAG: hypothetical protein AAFN30_21220 [Actinomycetota bacterium]